MAEAGTADLGKSDAGKSDPGADLGKGKRITGGDRSTLAGDLRKRYDGGESIRSLAESTNRSYGFVHRLLSESGATLRSRGGANRNSKKKA